MNILSDLTRRQRRSLIRILVSAVLLIIAAVMPTNGWIRLLSFLPSYLVIGYDVILAALKNILSGQLMDEKFLMMLATVGAYATGEYAEAAAVMLFYQIGELFQSIAVGRSRRSISALMDIRPDRATVLRDGEEVTVSPDEVKIGETIVIRPGERIPIDGTVTEGHAAVDLSALTGESLPADITVGDNATSGAVALDGMIKVETTQSFGESTVAKILELVENAASKKAKTENFVTRFARVYTPAVVAGACLLAFLPPVISGGAFTPWIQRALTFLVISCPCALVVSVPLSFFGGIGRASREGILIKGAGYLEAISGIKTVVFDKTGTLTRGSFSVGEVFPESGHTRDELLSLAAAAESYSTHPIAMSLRAATNGGAAYSATDISELAGMGVLASIDGLKIGVGNAELMRSLGISPDECTMPGTVIHVCRDDEYLGYIIISDEIKPTSAVAISRLRELGVRKTVMLTGDRRDSAEAVGRAIGIDTVQSELMPADKVNAIEELLCSNDLPLAFCGDGINDAPVLSRADIGIAMGVLGSDAAIEAADIVLMDDDPKKIARTVEISRKTMRIVWENIIFSLAVKAAVLALGATGNAGMWLAVFADVGVLVIAILNAMRALR